MENEQKPKNSSLEISEKTRAELGALFRGEEWRGEKLPPVFLKLFSAPHGTAEDIEGMKPLLDEADIYLPETSGWSGQYLSILQKMSEGKKFTLEPDEFQSAVEGYVFDSKKQIAFIDVPDKEVSMHPELYGEAEMYVSKMKRFSFEDARERFLEYMEESSKLDVLNREKYMIEHFADTIKEIIAKHPELKKKDAVKVLMTLGYGHSEIYFEMKSIGEDHVSRYFPDTPSRGYMSEGQRRIGFGKEVSEDLKGRAMLEGIFMDGIGHLFDRLSKKSSKNIYFLRYIISLFSEEEMKDAFQLWKEYDGNPAEILSFIMMKKGIVFPKTEEEMDVILENTPYGKYQKELQKKKEEKLT